MPDKREVEIIARKVRETQKAFLIDDGSGQNIWLPKSPLIGWYEGVNDMLEITIPEWLAKEKGLI